MKHYLKVNEDICSFEKWDRRKKHIDSVDGSLDKLILKFRSFYREAHLAFFNSIVKQIWLDQNLIYKGFRKTKRVGESRWSKIIYSQFMKIAVGTSHRVLTANFCFMSVATYFIDFFPEFLFWDPFENPEKYLYPYEHITLDYLVFVYQMDNRLELLKEAEKRGMSYAEFINWVTNWALCYNDDIKDDVYTLMGGHWNWPYIRNNKLKRFWENDKFNFNVKNE